MAFRKISKKDRKTLAEYTAFRDNVGELMEIMKEEILKDYKMRSDGIRHEGDRYTYLVFMAKEVEFSPGIKYSERFVIRPVFWVSKNAFVEEKPEDHGFKEDPEFKDYYIRELRLEEEFFELSPREQIEKILKFYSNVLEKFYIMGLVDKVQGFYIAG
jgi:hypothetical protein